MWGDCDNNIQHLREWVAEEVSYAWKRVIDEYGDHLNKKIWSINIQNVIWSKDVLGDKYEADVVSEYCAHNYPYQCGIQVNYWQKTMSETYPPTARLLIEVNENTHGGLQAVGVLGEDFMDAVDTVDGWNTLLWVEPYLWDLTGTNFEYLKTAMEEYQDGLGCRTQGSGCCGSGRK
jgi:hypothetical protein